MDYGRLLGDSWRVAWRHKYLWVLGLFAFGGSCSGGPSYNFGGGDVPVDGQGVGDVGAFTDFISSHTGLFLSLVAAFVLLGLVLFVVSFLATAGLIAGVDEAQAGRRSGLAFAWRRGMASFWRFLGLLLLVIAGGILAAVMVVFLLIVPALLALRTEGGLTSSLLVLILAGGLLVLLLVPAAIMLQIVLNWAYRSLVLEGTGVLASLAAGWRLMRGNAGTSLVLWVLDLALNWGLGLLLALPVAAVALPVVLGASVFEEAPPPVLAAGLLLGLVLLAALALFKAISSTFFAAYWTIAYRRLTGPVDGASRVSPTRSGPITVAPPEI